MPHLVPRRRQMCWFCLRCQLRTVQARWRAMNPVASRAGNRYAPSEWSLREPQSLLPHATRGVASVLSHVPTVIHRADDYKMGFAWRSRHLCPNDSQNAQRSRALRWIPSARRRKPASGSSLGLRSRPHRPLATGSSPARFPPGCAAATRSPDPVRGSRPGGPRRGPAR